VTHLPGAGSKTGLPGDVKIPNYTLSAPTELVIYEKSITVEDSKTLQNLITPNSGHWNWAACTEFPRM
jgi:filamentous hemagglutinin